MDDQKQQLIEKLKSANNVLVTVSASPSVDQLAACIALTIALNKLDKHATAVFSGDVPDTIEFLKPEETLEKNTDSLRDFIIALDKAKADKLRYKVEDKVVKIFITPYKTSISEDDLNFSQGDFNVDVVVALGVQAQQDLDQAITAHGRILHDATVLGVHNQPGSELGNINWTDPAASSLSELTTALIKQLDKKLIDEQIATALLTGIVAETDRFRNEKTSAQTMSTSADLMAAGANQQLVTSKLDHALEVRKPAAVSDAPAKKNKASGEPKKNDTSDNAGTLEINHDKPASQNAPDTNFDASKFDTSEPDRELPSVEQPADQPPVAGKSEPVEQRDVMTEPPRFNSPLTANGKVDSAPFEPSPDMSSEQGTAKAPLLSHDHTAAADEQHPPAAAENTSPPTSNVAAVPEPMPPAAPAVPPVPPTTPQLTEPEPQPTEQPSADDAAVTEVPDVDAARDEVMRALSEQPDETLPPVAALNAQALGEELHPPQPPAAPVPSPEPATRAPLPQMPDLPPAAHSPADQPLDMPLPPSGTGVNIPPPQATPPTNAPADPSQAKPPAAPPPIIPPNWPGPQQ